ncbi:hypothetical protein CRENPOLYSF1_240043 [Crenothrix polyspora]|uniref:Uncharacterized protein n=1 Tax=Crenothrix polyspora TaxID=360316 RepID=A0A1R4H7V4_9GAMM|nr:hypothetical protein CRENPOLYSF1_240043 [Crenothrix polyspora]
MILLVFSTSTSYGSACRVFAGAKSPYDSTILRAIAGRDAIRHGTIKKIRRQTVQPPKVPVGKKEPSLNGKAIMLLT